VEEASTRVLAVLNGGSGASKGVSQFDDFIIGRVSIVYLTKVVRRGSVSGGQSGDYLPFGKHPSLSSNLQTYLTTTPHGRDYSSVSPIFILSP
jgi:hypothetical protein